MHTLAAPEPTHAPTTRRSWQGTSLIVGGVVFAIGNALHPLEHSQAAYGAATWQAAHLTILFSLPFMVVGLPAVHRRLAARLPTHLATVPVVAVMVGLVGIAPSCLIEAFVAPKIGYPAMHELDTGGMAVVSAVFGIAYIGGSIALGSAVRRAGIGPRGLGTALVVDSLVLLVCMGLTGPVGGALIIASTIVYGSALAVLGARS